MIGQIGRFTLAAALATAATVGLAGESWAECDLAEGLYHFDFGGSEYPDCFRDAQVPPGGRIAPGMDLGGTGHTALNMTGSAGAGGATWLTVVDQAPGDPFQDNIYRSEFLCADILIQRFNNRKGAGVVTFFNQVDKQGHVVDKKGLALILYNAGNTDRLVLATVDGFPAKAGKLAVVKTLPLGGLIRENAWYRVLLTAIVVPVDDQQPEGSQRVETVTGRVFTHATVGDDQSQRNPNGPITRVGGILSYAPDSLHPLPAGVDGEGQNAIIGSAIGAVMNASVTNFTNMVADCCDGLAVEACLGGGGTLD